MVTRKFLHDYYTGEGEAIDHQKLMYTNPWANRRLKTIKDFVVEKVRGKLVLDLGCAEGLYCRHMQQQGAKVVGVDISLPKLKRAKARGGAIEYLKADWDFLPFKTDAFDFTLFSEGLEHTLDPEHTLNEIYRVSKMVHVSTPVYEKREHYPSDPFEKPELGHLHFFRFPDMGKMIGPRILEITSDDHYVYVVARGGHDKRYLIVNDYHQIIGGTEERLHRHIRERRKIGEHIIFHTQDKPKRFNWDEIDAVECHNLYLMDTKWVLEAKKRGIPVMLYPHDYWACGCDERILWNLTNCLRPGREKCMRCVGKQRYERATRRWKESLEADMFMVASQFMKRKLTDLDFPKERILVDSPKVDPTFKPLNMPRRREVLFVGSGKPYKGLPILMEAWELIKEKLPDVKLRVHDPGVNYVSHKQLCAYYNEVSLVVVPSIWEEPYGLVSAEARACGTPVIASNIGGLPETKPTILVEPENPYALAYKIHQFFKR